MKIRILLATFVAAMAAFGATAATAEAASPATAATQLTIPITPAQTGGILNGVLTITGFAVDATGRLVATGTFTGTVAGVLGTVTTTFTTVLSGGGGSCKILDLTLGPLHLDLLGLVIDLNQVRLTITAQQGPGNLLGNLLCALTGLLDANAAPNAIQRLLDLIKRLFA